VNPFEDWLGTGPVATLVAIASILVVAALLYVLVRKALLPLKDRVVGRTVFPWDDVILDANFRRWWALLFPAVFVHLAVPLIPGLSDFWSEFWLRVTATFAILIGVLTTIALMRAVNTVYETLSAAKERSIKGYLQVIQIVVLTFGGIWMLAVLSNESVWFFLSGFGAVAAVLLLFYRDTILSFVASMQLAQNDMIRVGDWIEMPQYAANGIVIDMALVTVKVQNWDKTITTIPTYKLTSESFKNWRGMNEAGARRIQRSINLDISSIRFLTDEEVARYALSRPAGADKGGKRAKTAAENAEHIASAGAANGQTRFTNVDALRSHLITYLNGRPELATDTMPFVIRQLAPGPQGLPLEIYVFCRETEWEKYEAIQGEIIGHALAMLPQFGLRAFTEPTDQAIRSVSEAHDS
jgi:miniconductance mechanosensitive channel